MLQIISVVGPVAGYPALRAFAGGGSAVSSEAIEAQRVATVVVESSERSQALFGEKSAAISQLTALAKECVAQGWDGEDAAPVDSLVVLLVARFLRAMPDGIPLPEFAPEPDGSISLDWIQSRVRLFSLSIGRSNRLAFAWLDGADKGYGVARFDGQNVPSRILNGIRGMVGQGHAALRAA